MSIIEILINPSLQAIIGSILAMFLGVLFEKYIMPKTKEINITKPIIITFKISIAQIILFLFKYLLPAIFIVYLMIADVVVDRWFVLSISICFSALIISFVRDMAFHIALKIIRGIGKKSSHD